MDKGYKRRNFFIKRDFQGRLILGYFLFVTGGCLFFIVLLGLFSADSLTIAYNNHDIQFGQTPFMLMKSVEKISKKNCMFCMSLIDDPLSG